VARRSGKGSFGGCGGNLTTKEAVRITWWG
jgi:hypothetical protein